MEVWNWLICRNWNIRMFKCCRFFRNIICIFILFFIKRMIICMIILIFIIILFILRRNIIILFILGWITIHNIFWWCHYIRIILWRNIVMMWKNLLWWAILFSSFRTIKLHECKILNTFSTPEGLLIFWLIWAITNIEIMHIHNYLCSIFIVIVDLALML